MSIPREESPEAEVWMIFNADSKKGLNALFSWLDDGLVKEPPEPLAEGKFVALLEAAVHRDVVARLS